MSQKIAIALTDRERKLLMQLSVKRRLEKQLTMRILIVLTSSDRMSYKRISSELGCSEPTIAKWKQRWSDNYEKLTGFSKGLDGSGVSDRELMKEMLTILGDSPRRGAPVTFGQEVQAKIQALACESPSKYSLPFTHWTHASLAQQAVALQLVVGISSRHIGRLLKKQFSSP